MPSSRLTSGPGTPLQPPQELPFWEERASMGTKQQAALFPYRLRRPLLAGAAHLAATRDRDADTRTSSMSCPSAERREISAQGHVLHRLIGGAPLCCNETLLFYT